jgi:hypothetical protein
LRRPIWCIIALSLAAALAAIAATPPNLVKAIEAQRRITAQRPQDAGVWNDLGNLLVLAQHRDEAEEAYRRAVELDPAHASALFNLGLLMAEKGGRKEAFDFFERVVAAEPGNAWAHYQLGALHEGFGRKGRAIEEYATAFALDPQLALADVNPHVVDSELTTEAMLIAYRGGYGRTAAPQAWSEPGRIADMLIPSPADAKRADEAAGEVAEEEGGTVQPGVPGQQGPDGRVLREGTIERGGNVGQASPPGVRRPGGPQRQPAAQPGVRTWTRPDPVVDGEEEGPLEEQGGEVFVPPPTPGGYLYQPGLPSTGRLDVKVVPDRLARR